MMELIQNAGPSGLLVVGLGLVFLGTVLVQAFTLRRLDLTRLIVGAGALMAAVAAWSVAHGMLEGADALAMAGPDQQPTMLVMVAGIAISPAQLSFLILVPGGVLAGLVLTLRANLAGSREVRA